MMTAYTTSPVLCKRNQPGREHCVAKSITID